MFLRRGVSLSARDMVSYMPRHESTLVYVDVHMLRDSGIVERLFGSAIAEDAEYTFADGERHRNRRFGQTWCTRRVLDLHRRTIN